jgi:nucleoside-diphosphate-sugar epimerase
LNKKIIITGANGYVGKNFIALLKKKKFKILKIKTTSLINKIKVHGKFNAFIHLGFEIKKNCNIKNQVKILKNVINISKNNCKKLIFTSTAATGPKKKRKIITKNNYQKAKYICEKILKKDKSSVKITILRIFNIIGPNQKLGFLITDLISKFITKKEIEIYNYLNKRDYVYIDDVCRAIYCTLKNKSDKFQIIEVGSGKNLSLLKVAEKIKHLLKSDKKIIKGNKYKSPIKTKALLKNQKIKWIPKTNIDKALNLIIKNYEKKNWNNLPKVK